MAEFRQRIIQGLVDEDLTGRVGDVIVATDDMGDLHGHVVDNDREIIGRGTIGAQDDQVVQLAVVKRQFAMNEVDETRLPLQRGFQADRRFAIGRRTCWKSRQRRSYRGDSPRRIASSRRSCNSCGEQ